MWNCRRCTVKVKVTRLCPTLYDPMDCAPTGVGGLSLLQGIVPTQGSNPGLLHFGQILYQLSHKGSPRCTVMWSIITESALAKSVMIITWDFGVSGGNIWDGIPVRRNFRGPGTYGYGLNVHVTLQIHMLKPWFPHMIVIGSRASVRQLGYETGALINGIRL